MYSLETHNKLRKLWLGRIRELHFDFYQIQAVKFLQLLCLFGIPTDPQTLFTLKNSEETLFLTQTNLKGKIG